MNHLPDLLPRVRTIASDHVVSIAVVTVALFVVYKVSISRACVGSYSSYH